MGTQVGDLSQLRSAICKPLPQRLFFALCLPAAYVYLVSGIHNSRLSLRTLLKG